MAKYFEKYIQGILQETHREMRRGRRNGKRGSSSNKKYSHHKAGEKVHYKSQNDENFVLVSF